MKKIGIRILGCMALLSMVGCGRIEGASVQDLSNTGPMSRFSTS